jgi:NADPH2:quinone reductase
VITAVADDVKDWRVGERVMAYTRLPKIHAGTYAEFINLPAGYVAKVPDQIELWQAAALPLVGLTAYQALHSIIGLKAGEKVLIPGGAGGVGSLAIQFAKAIGAEVTTTARAVNHGYLRELGADYMVDYTTNGSTAELRQIAPLGFDAVFDCAGGSSLEQAWQVIKSGGRLVSIVDTPDTNRAAALNVKATYHFVEPSGAQLQAIGDLINQGKVIIPQIEVKSVREAAAAQDENQERRVRGKVVLKIDF